MNDDTRAAPGASGAGSETPLSLQALTGPNINPLVAAAAPLLACAAAMRTSVQQADPTALKESLATGLRAFESQARAQALPHEQVIAARYILCTALDEAAASTAWGGSGAWSTHSLLVQFHNETWGGEKVFQLMARLSTDVAVNRNLLELLYLVLAFGFEGRWRVIDGGRAQLEGVRERLLRLLRRGQPQADTALSPHWKTAVQPAAALRGGLSLWWLAGGAVLLLAGLMAGLRISLDRRAEPVVAALADLDTKTGATPAPVVAKPRLLGFLRPEIDAGLVEVLDMADRSVVTIRGDAFFEPGSAEMSPVMKQVMPRIAMALTGTPGAVLITGHTDSQPVRRQRNLTNQQLSQNRAEAVRAALAATVDPARLRAEGRADSEPVAANTGAAGRARNRRVEITLMVPPPSANRQPP